MTLCVVLDTNAWLSHRMLRSPLGLALLHSLKVGNVRLGLPEVVENEIVRNAPRLCSDAVRTIDSKLEYLRALSGRAPTLELPTDDVLLDRVQKRIAELESHIVRVSFTLAHAKSALNRVLDGTPPNGKKNQQFKDSVIWEAILKLVSDHDVHFVTNDGGFFADDRRKNLARELAEECESIDVRVTIYNDLGACLEVLRDQATDFEDLQLRDSLRAWAFDFGEPLAHDQAFEVEEILDPECKYFVTEDTDVIAAGFRIGLKLAGSDGNARIEGKLWIDGEAEWSIDSEQCTNVTPHAAKFHWINADGSVQSPSFVYASTRSDPTRADQRFRSREPLDKRRG